MKITIKYSKEEKKNAPDPKSLKDVTINATDFYLVSRYMQDVQDKKDKKVLYKIPKVTSQSTNGGNFREINKEVRQSLTELDASSE